MIHTIQASPVMIITGAKKVRINAFSLVIQNKGTLAATMNGGWTLQPGDTLNIGFDNTNFQINDTFDFSFASGVGTARIEILEFNLGTAAHNI